ncbi:MAG TPA: SIR2 family protein [Thermoanaerobaculia bacterium]|jgi:hypothetical protein|nr:SIR2 family protein [Thermoanaerobaculia bacterium]
MAWPNHVLNVGPVPLLMTDEVEQDKYRRHIEPWLSALFQSEHLALLAGSGLTVAVSDTIGQTAKVMATTKFKWPISEKLPAADADTLDRRINAYATATANRIGRGTPNIEDQIRAATDLLTGLAILADDRAEAVRDALNGVLREFLAELIATEARIRAEIANKTEKAQEAQRLLISFLLSFASRVASRERLNIFTTNYDRLIEYGCDMAGLRIIDRFVGTIAPLLRSTRVDIDFHYNPPGIRGEPRYLEGVVRLTKLHGSLDWRADGGEVQRVGISFGASADEANFPKDPLSRVMIYPNPAKDVETVDYPYAELFRDFSAATCRPNSTLVTYGYGFGDDHLNRVIEHMMSLPSTHLVIISFDGASGRIERFFERVGRPAQISLLIGSHFGALATLVEKYLPKPAIDRITFKMAELRARRGAAGAGNTEVGTNDDAD